MRSKFLVMCALAVGLLGSACAHETKTARVKETDARRLFMLERAFSEFVSVRLDTDDEGRPLTGHAALANVDGSMATLESLRLSYLDMVGNDTAPSTRVLALVRMSELHLDLGARVRRIPYPAASSRAEKLAFDLVLSRIALPLEATAAGILKQATDLAARHGVDDRFSRRAALYLVLHGEGARLDDDHAAQLALELEGARAFPAPRRLLEGGRVGQRAARIQR